MNYTKIIWLELLILGFMFSSDLSGGNREADGKEVSVRMIGIDAPESRSNKRLDRQMRQQNKDKNTILELGEKSKAHLKELVGKNEFVYLEYDVQKFDKYGRVLAYVYILDKKGKSIMLNEQMLKDGFACLLTIPPNVKHVDRFLKCSCLASLPHKSTSLF